MLPPLFKWTWRNARLRKLMLHKLPGYTGEWLPSRAARAKLWSELRAPKVWTRSVGPQPQLITNQRYALTDVVLLIETRFCAQNPDFSIMSSGLRSPSPARSRSPSVNRERSRTRSPSRRSVSNRSRSPRRSISPRSRSYSRSRSRTSARSPSPRRNGRRSYTPDSRSPSRSRAPRGRSGTRSPTRRSASPAPRSAKVRNAP